MLAPILALLFAVPVQLVLASGSRLWIDGDSNLRTWSCEAHGLETHAEARTADAGGVPSVRQVELAVPVDELRCGDDHMESKLRESLKSSKHPRIEYTLTSVQQQTGSNELEKRMKTTGLLTVAGRTRTVTMLVHAGVLHDGTLRARGSVPLQMSDYGVDAPSALLGLVKAKDRIVVRFDLRARAVFEGQAMN